MNFKASWELKLNEVGWPQQLDGVGALSHGRYFRIHVHIISFNNNLMSAPLESFHDSNDLTCLASDLFFLSKRPKLIYDGVMFD